MTNVSCIPAIVLAAGLSSRFGKRHKALAEPCGPGLLARAVQHLRLVGIHDILVVTGYRGEEVAAQALALKAQPVPNPEYARGMFSSVKTGLAALTDVPAFLLLPVDALVHPQSLLSLLSFWTQLPAAEQCQCLLVPCHQGKPGHPPLIGHDLRDTIFAQTDAQTGGLRSALASLMDKDTARLFVQGENLSSSMSKNSVYFLDMPDAGILTDIDRPEDLAPALTARPQLKDRPSLEEAWTLLTLARLPRNKRRHCLAVSTGAMRLVLALSRQGHPCDIELAVLGGLLHDFARPERNHALAGRLRLEALGFPLLALAVGAHTNPPPVLVSRFTPTPDTVDDPEYALLAQETHEAILAVYLADKYYLQDQPVGLEERFAASRPTNASGTQQWAHRKTIALAAAKNFQKILGEDPETIVRKRTNHPHEQDLARLAATL